MCDRRSPWYQKETVRSESLARGRRKWGPRRGYLEKHEKYDRGLELMRGQLMMARMWCGQAEQLMTMSGVTIVAAISRHVLYFQGPFSLRILVPRVGGHEGPVVESLRGEVIGPERKVSDTKVFVLFSCGWEPKGVFLLSENASGSMCAWVKIEAHTHTETQTKRDLY